MPRLIIILYISCLSFSAFAEFKPYTELMTQERKEFVDKVKAKVQEANELPEDKNFDRLEILRSTLQMVLSRPDRDNTLLEAIPEIKRPLVDEASYEETLLSLTKQSIRALKANTLPTEALATHQFILENMISEVRPCYSSNQTCKDIVKSIKDAELETSVKVKSYRRLNGMHKTYSVSEMANKIIELEDKKAKEKEKAKSTDSK